MLFRATACADTVSSRLRKRMLLLLTTLIAVGGVARGSDESRQLQWRRAIDTDNLPAIERLFDPALLSITNEKGKTALMTAAKLGDFNLYQKLLDGGLEPGQRSRTGGTVLMYAVLGNRLEFVEYVLSQNPQIDLQSTNGWTAAMIAAAKGYGDVLKKLIAAGADVNIADAYRWSPLMRAIDNRHRETVNILARVPGVKLDWQNENGATALHIAASVGDLPTVRLLASLDAGINVRDNNGQRAVDVAENAGHANIFELLELF